ncbi:Disease resistance protein [Thalictrum thalictroides]|uniref:Disease resistance protein n=1 Tax=Thalictrum thalictroides TaxID=46969 RepID=A0A7J6WH86_THATH|nr:Disease resistance protein [Thalictrum thalictroides]
MKEVELFEKISEILQTNRYLVVLDDIWSKEAWDALKPAFPNNKGCKVMFTTRNLEVAKHADQWSFHLEQRPLTDEEAWVLLCRNAFPPNVSSSLLCDFEECGRNIVKKCGGFPLQVIVLGGILASKGTVDEWEAVSKQIGTHTSHDQGDKIFSILSLSYNELPYNMKPLFLYLGLFPEDSLISVNKLVRMWMAESLIRQEKEGETIEEVGTRYLDELIHRSMVQIGEKSMGQKKIKTCQLHDKMRELCITIGMEENFFKAINENGDSSSSSCLVRTSKKLRRCAIYIQKDGEQYVFPKEFTRYVRTAFFIQKNPFVTCSSITFIDFKLLKVLEFQGSLQVKNNLIRALEMLSNLRYLCITKFCAYEMVNILFKSFKNLVCLQTLDIRNIGMIRRINQEVPNTMHQLRHFYATGMYLSNVSRMTKLQTLYKAWAGPWIAGLVQLTNLEKLGIEDLDEATMGLLTIAIGGGGLDKLRSLYLSYREENGSSSYLLEALSAKHHLQKLTLYGRIKKLPSKFPSNLIKLSLNFAHLSENLMPTLEKLQHLLFLHLGPYSYDGKKMVWSANGFPKLQQLEISSLSQLEEWTVEEGAMPCLMTCDINNCWKLNMVPQGFKFLTMLQELKIRRMPVSFEERVKEQGEDWETIKHITSITIGNQ